jgi:hypothetical protein
MEECARGGTLEGLGGPVRMDAVRHDGIDPTLDSCCQREVRVFKSCIGLMVLVSNIFIPSHLCDLRLFIRYYFTRLNPIDITMP